MAALVLVKEDMPPLLSCFGLLLIVQGETRRGLGLVAASIVSAALVLGVIIPMFSDTGTYGYSSAYADVLRRPWTIPLVLVSPLVKLRTMVLWLAPFLFLPLRSPLCVLLLPFVATRFLSSSPTHWGTIFHYSAPLAPVLAMAAVDGLARMANGAAPARRSNGVSVAAARSNGISLAVAAMVILCAILPGNQPLWRVFRPRHYRATAFHSAGYEALATIPEGASVVAQAAVVPHLSRRDSVYVLDGRTAPRTEFVVASTDANPWPGTDAGTIEKWLQAHRDRGYVEVFARGGWTVLRHPAQGR
jgi:uncharacterized membrane protein